MSSTGSEETRNDWSDSIDMKSTMTADTSPVMKFDISLQYDGDSGDDVGCYQPGDQLSGDVVVVVNSPIRVSSLVVELRGEASVAWKTGEYGDRCRSDLRSAQSAVTGRRRPPRESCSRWYQASELYIDERQEMLLDTDDSVLQPGEHRFPLSFQLPRSLPTSFHGKFGGVSYVLRASFVDETSTSARRLAAARYVVTEPFFVRRPSRPPPSQVKPVSVKLSRRLFAAAPFICASGLLRVDFTIVDGTVYYPGDDIHVAVQLTNDSPRVVIDVVLTLVQLCEFRSLTSRRRCGALVSRRCAADCRLTPTGYADCARCTHFRLSVPPNLPESRLDGCDVIDVGYELRFAVEVTGSRRRLKRRLPITVLSAEQASQRRASHLHPNGPASAAANDVIAGSRALSLSDEIISNFRRPMTPGETKQNIAFDVVLEHDRNDSTNVERF